MGPNFTLGSSLLQAYGASFAAIAWGATVIEAGMSSEKREKPQHPVATTETPAGLGPYLTISGRGEPAGSLFEAKVSALYSVVYAVKLGMGRSGRDCTVAALEGFWLKQGDGARAWKLGIRAPAGVAARDLAAAIASLSAKGKDPLVKDVMLESLDEHQVEHFPIGDAAAAAVPS
jgi:hypothetical protein